MGLDIDLVAKACYDEEVFSTPLQLAVQHNHFDVVAEFVSNGVDINKDIALRKATTTKMVEELIKLGAVIERANEDNQWIQELVESKEGMKIVSYLVKECGFNINNRNDNSHTALHEAAIKSNNAEVIEELIKLGAEIDALTSSNITPFLWACAKSNTSENVEVLIKHGCDMTIKDEFGMNGLIYTSCDSIMIELLKSPLSDIHCSSDGHTPLHAAAAKGLVEGMKEMIKRGANVNARDNEGRTPLHLVTGAEAVLLLLEGGADINSMDKEGMTPLHLAALKSDYEVEAILRRKGAETEIKDKSGMTASAYTFFR